MRNQTPEGFCGYGAPIVSCPERITPDDGLRSAEHHVRDQMIAAPRESLVVPCAYKLRSDFEADAKTPDDRKWQEKPARCSGVHERVVERNARTRRRSARRVPRPLESRRVHRPGSESSLATDRR